MIFWAFSGIFAQCQYQCLGCGVEFTVWEWFGSVKFGWEETVGRGARDDAAAASPLDALWERVWRVRRSEAGFYILDMLCGVRRAWPPGVSHSMTLAVRFSHRWALFPSCSVFRFLDASAALCRRGALPQWWCETSPDRECPEHTLGSGGPEPKWPAAKWHVISARTLSG